MIVASPAELSIGAQNMSDDPNTTPSHELKVRMILDGEETPVEKGVDLDEELNEQLADFAATYCSLVEIAEQKQHEVELGLITNADAEQQIRDRFGIFADLLDAA